MGRYIYVAGINLGPCVLKHKYHRHWNHGRPRVGFWGILGGPSIEPLLGGGPAGGLYRPPPPRKRKPGFPCLNNKTLAVATNHLLCAPPRVCTALCVHCLVCAPPNPPVTPPPPYPPDLRGRGAGGDFVPYMPPPRLLQGPF